MKQFRIGIVGTNTIAQSMLEAMRRVPGLIPSAVCANHPSHAQAFAKENAIPFVYDSFTAMLAQKEGPLDAVYLASPNALHASMSLACMKAGLSVFVEKPLCATFREAQDLYKTAAEKNVCLLDGIVPLYTDAFAAVKRNLSSLGPIRRVVVNYSRYSSRYDAYLRGENPPTFQKELQNGAWMDLGVYCIANVVGWFGEPRRIQASSTFLESGVDATGTAILSYDGFDAVVLISKVSTSFLQSEIEGENGTILYALPGIIGRVIRKDRLTGVEECLHEGDESPLTMEMRDFYETLCRRDVESARVRHAQSAKIISTLEQCRHVAGIRFEKEKQ